MGESFLWHDDDMAFVESTITSEYVGVAVVETAYGSVVSVETDGEPYLDQARCDAFLTEFHRAMMVAGFSSERDTLRAENEQLRATVAALEDRCRALEAEVQRFRDSQSKEGPKHGLIPLAHDSFALWNEGSYWGEIDVNTSHYAAWFRGGEKRSEHSTLTEAETWLREQAALVGGAGPGVGDLGVIDRPEGSIVAPESAPPVATTEGWECPHCGRVYYDVCATVAMGDPGPGYEGEVLD